MARRKSLVAQLYAARQKAKLERQKEEARASREWGGRAAGFEPSLSKVSALRSGKPVSVRLDDLDKICAALGCTVGDLLEAELLADAAPERREAAAGGGKNERAPGKRPRPRRGGGPRSLPPN